MHGSGYSVNMDYGMQQKRRKRRRYLPSFLATTLWLVPVMLLAAAGGFFLATNVASKYVDDSTVQRNRPRPDAILSPEEAAKVARDQESHVWTQGVRQSDIPSYKPEADGDTAPATSRRTRRSTTRPRVTRPASTEAQPADTVPTTGDTALDGAAAGPVDTGDQPPAETPPPSPE